MAQFSAPDAPYCDLQTARVTIILAPLEYSVCYLKGTEYGPQAILDASSQMELYEVFERGQLPLTIGGKHFLSAPPVAAVRDSIITLT